MPRTLTLLLLLAAPLAAAPPDPPKVPATVAVPSGEPVVIVGETPCAAVEYFPLTPGLKVPSIVKALNIAVPPKNYIGEGPDGVYEVLAWTGNADGPSKAAKIVVTIGRGKKVDPKPAPKPKPEPAPQPKPAPVVKAEKIQAVFVEETEEKSSKRSQFVGSKEIRDRLAARGHPAPVIADQNVKDGATDRPPAKLAPYLDRARGKTLPQLYLVDAATGKVLYEGPVPATVADFLKLFDQLGG